MRVHNLYVDAKGETHFRDIEVEFAESGRAGKTSKRIPATGIIFRQVQPDYDLDWHPAPQGPSLEGARRPPAPLHLRHARRQVAR